MDRTMRQVTEEVDIRYTLVSDAATRLHKAFNYWYALRGKSKELHREYIEAEPYGSGNLPRILAVGEEDPLECLDDRVFDARTETYREYVSFIETVIRDGNNRCGQHVSAGRKVGSPYYISLPDAQGVSRVNCLSPLLPAINEYVLYPAIKEHDLVDIMDLIMPRPKPHRKFRLKQLYTKLELDYYNSTSYYDKWDRYSSQLLDPTMPMPLVRNDRVTSDITVKHWVLMFLNNECVGDAGVRPLPEYARSAPTRRLGQQQQHPQGE